jgi:Flp pilus assembly protein TadG
VVRGRLERRRQRKHEQEQGQALVEFLLVSPLLLLLVFGVLEFGKALNYWIDLTHLANEGSRYASVNRWPGCPTSDTGTCTPTSLSQYVVAQTNTSELATGKAGSNVEDPLGVTVCYPTSGTSAGAPIQVRVSTVYKLQLVNGILGLVGLGNVADIDMSAKSTMRLERTPTADRVLQDAPAACPA